MADFGNPAGGGGLSECETGFFAQERWTYNERLVESA